MGTAPGVKDVVGKAHYHFVVAVVILNGYFSVHAVAVFVHIKGNVKRVLVAVNRFHKRTDPALKVIIGLVLDALIFEVEKYSFSKVGKLLEAIRQEFKTRRDILAE